MQGDRKVTALPIAEHVPERVQRVIQLFEREGADPKAIAKKLRFEDHRELGRFMKLHGYVWSTERRNYVQEEWDDVDMESNGQTLQEDQVHDHKVTKTKGRSGVSLLPPPPATSVASYLPLLEYLARHQDRLQALIEGSAEQAALGSIPRYTVPGVLVTKSVHMSHDLDLLVRNFSKERNISQREIFEVALIEFFKKYGYAREVQRLLAEL